MNYPDTVQIETTTACNAHCSFCPHSDLVEAGRKGRMSEELLDKIFAEITSWPVKPRSICPFLTNEPFADPRIFEIIGRCKQAAPDCEITIFTNASLLTPARLNQLSLIYGPINIFCSLHHRDAASYRAELGLDFDTTVRNIKNLVHGFGQKVTVLRVSDGTPNDGAFDEWARNEFPGANIMVAARWNWKGDRATYETNLHSDIKCPRGGSITILHDGRVSLCCLDQAGQYALGDVTKQTVLEVFNGAAHERFYGRAKSESTPCKTCNMR